MHRRFGRFLLIGLLSAMSTTAAVVVVPSAADAVPPPTPAFGPSIDPIPVQAPYQCAPVTRPGTRAFADLLRNHYGIGYGSLTRPCDASWGDPNSQHKAGRAVDWSVNYFNAGQRAIAEEVIAWLLATDQHGNQFANARRLGIAQIIWNERSWRAVNGDGPDQSTWDICYTGGNTCGGSAHRDHMHFTLSANGADGLTSWYTGAGATGSKPFGHLDSLAVVPSTQSIRATGWTIDPDVPSTPLTIHVYVDGVYAGGQLANRNRPDVGAVHPAAGPNHGFDISIPTLAGSHEVCTYALNNTAGGGNTLLGGSCRTVVAYQPPVGDFDDDQRTDYALFRPSTSNWYVDNHVWATYGSADSIPVPGNYDDDPATEVASWEADENKWSVSGNEPVFTGQPGDIPVPGDYTGDGRTDYAVWRPSTSTWYVNNIPTAVYGSPNSIPVPGNYDDDPATEIASWDPALSKWSVSGKEPVFTGTAGDIPAIAAPNRVVLQMLGFDV